MNPIDEIKRQPFFSVIIPTYNRAILLLDAINSVLTQSFRDFELIVVDDYSTDNTREIMAMITDERLQYVLNKHVKGVSGARNTGIFMARGEWIAFLDSDDVWLSDKLSCVWQRIQISDAEIGLIYTGYATYDFSERREISRHLPSREGWIRDELLYNNYVGTFSVVAFRSDLLRTVGGCDERYEYFEDNDLYVRIAEVSRVKAIKEILTYVREANSDRLNFQLGKRLNAYELFRSNHRAAIERSPRLRHRTASLIFLYSVILREWGRALQSLGWTLAGLLFDIPNFFRTCWGVISLLSQPRDEWKVR